VEGVTAHRRPNALGQVARPGRNSLGQVPGLGRARRTARRIQARAKAGELLRLTPVEDEVRCRAVLAHAAGLLDELGPL
jgi:hypothetical protein